MDNQFIKEGINLIKEADAAYLSTIDANGYPITRAMLNLKNKNIFPKLVNFMSKQDDLTLFFTTNTSSSKVKDIMKNPRVSVYFCDVNNYNGFMCQGDIEIVKDKQLKHDLWLDEWVMYYPEGKDSEDYTVLKLEPKYVRRYHGLHQEEMKL
jgi:general stress protein 26